ncbi:MAG: iron-sulfur cluster assembly accessory protein [Acidiferrobacteraceae bacterium]|nr:iron-sulfur cluster assembly accessory protein [Acidiferrobacteraceae bacterium]
MNREEGRSSLNSLEDLAITDAARSKITDLIASQGDNIDSVRVYVAGGGCGGMNYGMTFADVVDSRDTVIEEGGGFRMVIDPLAMAYMQGAEIDYTEDGPNSTFVFNNVFKAVGGSGACGGCGGASF